MRDEYKYLGIFILFLHIERKHWDVSFHAFMLLETYRWRPSRRYSDPHSTLPPPPSRRYGVDHVCNLTDVDDKIIARMTRDGVTLGDLTDKYASLFFEDLESLNIIPASRYPRATEHIDDIVEMIQVGCLVIP